jgi:hypothetical protein
MESLEKVEQSRLKAEEAMSRLKPVIFDKPVLEEPEEEEEPEEQTEEDLYNESLFERFDNWRKE